MDNLEERIERTIFEALRVKIVSEGYLPDITDNVLFPKQSNIFTQVAQQNWDQALKSVVATKGFAVEVFGTSSSFGKGLIKAPRIVIVSKRIMMGDIGFPPGYIYESTFDPLNPNDKVRVETPGESSNMHFDIHLVSSSQKQSRFINWVLNTVLGKRKYLQFLDSINPSERFFIKHYNYYDVSDTDDGVEDNVYSYEVQDLYIFGEILPGIIKPIKQINTEIIIGYEKDLLSEITPSYPNDVKIDLEVS